jgi:hypothetical protein
VPGENLGTGGPITIAVGVADAAGPMILSSSGGAPVCAAVNPVSDGLRLVHADAGSIIYQRLTAMPRIRWASGAVIIPDSAARLAALKRGVPPTDVVLNAAGPTAAGRPATVTVRTDRGGAIAADVNAQGSGYLVVADAMQRPGWSVTVDGKPAKVVHADHAMVAVAVPQGTHRIAFHYRAPGQRTGALLSGVALLILIALVGWEWRRRRLGGKPRGVTQATAAPDQAPPAPASTEPAALRSP